MTTVDILDELREYEPDVDEKYVIDRAIAEIVRLRRAEAKLEAIREWVKPGDNALVFKIPIRRILEEPDPDGVLAEFDRNRAR